MNNSPRKNQKKAIIKQVVSGKQKGQYKFKCTAGNGEPVLYSHPESYHNIADAIKAIKSHCAPDFIICVQTGKNVEVVTPKAPAPKKKKKDDGHLDQPDY